MKKSNFSFKITFEKREERRKLRIKIFFLLTFKSSWHRILRSWRFFSREFFKKTLANLNFNIKLLRSEDRILPQRSVTSDPQPEQRTPEPEPGNFPPPSLCSDSDTDLQLEPEARWCHSGAWPHSSTHHHQCPSHLLLWIFRKKLYVDLLTCPICEIFQFVDFIIQIQPPLNKACSKLVAKCCTWLLKWLSKNFLSRLKLF